MTVYRLITVSMLAFLAMLAAFVGVRSSLPTAAATSAAEIRVNTPAAPQPVGVQFEITTELDRFTTGGGVTTWGGYQLELTYDSGVQVDAVTRGICSDSGWGNPQNTPFIETGCAFQSSTATGILEHITLECIAAGPVQLHFRTVPEAGVEGTTMFDEGATNIPTDLVDGSINCGAPTPTGTPTKTPTPTITPTFTVTPIPTATSTPVPGPDICSTNVGGPPTLGNGLDCDTDTRFGGVLGDGCIDSEDVDPHDPWDFYSVPVPALILAADPTTDFRDNVVNARDAQAVFRYFLASASAGSGVYEQDLNGNGVKDGWEYDRSEAAAGVLGPPDGVITAQDAQAVFVQFKANRKCTSGYTMVKPLCTTNVGGAPTLGNGRDCDRDVAFPTVLGDGCVDSEDANRTDPWDYYTVPVPSLLHNPNALRDNLVGPSDAQAIFSYFLANARAGFPVYEQDLNHNGIKDGWEYDRANLGPGVLGPPDGIVTAQDAQLAFSQFRSGVHCSSGYNMKNTAP